MKPNKVTLTANQTLLLMATKNHPHKGYIEANKLVFDKDKEEAVFNEYPFVADAVQKIISIPQKFIFLENVNEKLFELIEVVQPRLFEIILKEINRYNFVGTRYTTKQAIFSLLYGHLQALSVFDIKDGKSIELIKLDMSLVEEGE